MSIRHFAVFPVLLVATAAFGQGSASSAHADFIGTRGEKIGKATITPTSNGVKSTGWSLSDRRVRGGMPATC